MALIKAKRLVLVLDLDQTLLHSAELPVNPQSSRGRRERLGGWRVFDKLKSKYHISEFNPCPFSFMVKLRPFCAEFLIKAMSSYEIHFNTAATRRYGHRILEVLKYEVTEKIKLTKESESETLLK